MLHCFPGTFGSQRIAINRAATVTYTNTNIVSGGTIGTYGASWTQVIASTPYDSVAVRITANGGVGATGVRGDGAVILGTGASTFEVQKIGPLLFGGRQQMSSYTLPMFIPAGTRVSLKMAHGVVSKSVAFSVDILGGPNRHIGSLPTSWVAYGTTVTSGTGAYGTLHTPGSSNAWSSWTQIATSSATIKHSLWLPMAALGTATTVTAINYRTQFALASTTDAATMVTNNTGFIEGPWFTGSTTEQFGMYATAGGMHIIGRDEIVYAPRAVSCPLSVRAMCSATPDSNAMSMAFLAAVK